MHRREAHRRWSWSRATAARIGLPSVGVVALLVASGAASATGTRTIVAPYHAHILTGETDYLTGCGSHTIGVPVHPTLNLTTGGFAFAGWAHAASCRGTISYSLAAVYGNVGLIGPTFHVSTSGTHKLSATYSVVDSSHIIERNANSITLVQTLWQFAGEVVALNGTSSWYSSNSFQQSNSSTGSNVNSWYNSTTAAYTLTWNASLTSGHTYVFYTYLDAEAYVDTDHGSSGSASMSVTGTVVSFTVS